MPIFDAVFDQVFRGFVDPATARGDQSAPPLPAGRPNPDRRAPSQPSDKAGATGPARSRPAVAVTDGSEPPAPPDVDHAPAAASALEHLARRDFAELTPAELDQLSVLMDRVALAPPPRASRRHRSARRGARPDLRATLHRARRSGGDPVEWISERPRTKPRRLVLIADVSGSMEPYARAYLHLLHGAVRAAKAEAFVFATRLTRLTRHLAATDADVALARAMAAAPDWSGGTRIGAAVAAFNDDFGRRGVARGAVVVMVSDGWDTGDPAEVGEQMARLSRMAHRIVWVNPRVAADGFQPLVAGMVAALPHVDALVSGHSFEALEELMVAIGGSG